MAVSRAIEAPAVALVPHLDLALDDPQRGPLQPRRTARRGSRPLSPPLFGRLTAAMASGQTLAARVRALKLPLALSEPRLYAGAVSQLYFIVQTLESALEWQKAEPMVAQVRALGLRVAPEAAADLGALLGEEWLRHATAARTPATAAYCAALARAEPLELVAASFVVYSAVVGAHARGTRERLRHALPGCEHRLFDAGSDDKARARARPPLLAPARRTRRRSRADAQVLRQFQHTFTAIGMTWPEQCAQLEREAARFVRLNGMVERSIHVWGRRATRLTLVTLASAVVTAATAAGMSLLLAR
jgi:hypothetical protein